MVEKQEETGTDNIESAALDVLNAIAEFTEAVALIQAAIAEIDTKKEEATVDIEMNHEAAIANIEMQKLMAVAIIQGKKTEIEKIHAAISLILSKIQELLDPFRALFRQGM
ncbi:MAG: hypothetical protein AAGU17_13780 [Anaerolineaceae bacterium]